MLMIIVTVKIELYASLIDDTIPIKDDTNNEKKPESMILSGFYFLLRIIWFLK